MHKTYITVPGDEAPVLRQILRKHWLDGVQAQESRRWLLWRRFEISGPLKALQSIERDVHHWQSGQAEDRIL